MFTGLAERQTEPQKEQLLKLYWNRAGVKRELRNLKSDVAARILSKSFLLAMQIAAPFIVMGMLFYLGMGLLARLMPQVQIFFIAIPVQIFLGFLVMAMTLSASMMWFLGSFQNTFQGILFPG